MTITDEELESHYKTVAWQERLMVNLPGESVIILEDLDMLFSRSELALIKAEWVSGTNISDISKMFHREEDEVFLALFHMARNQRKNEKEPIILKFSQILGG